MNDKTYRILFAFLITLIGVLCMGLALGWTTPLDYLDMLIQGFNERWVMGITGAFIFLGGLLILRNTLKDPKPTQTEIIATNLGQIKITINALENMASKVAKQVTGVKETKTVIKSTPNGIALFIQVSLAPEIKIPQTTEELQTKIKDYFFNIAGIEVEEVKVLVTKLTHDLKSRVE